MTQSTQTITKEPDEEGDLVVQFILPLVPCERWIFLEDVRSVCGEHQDELFYLAVLLHLPTEGLVFDLPIKHTHRASNELLRIAEYIYQIRPPSMTATSGHDARRILSHRDKLELVFQHLEKVPREFCAFGTLSQILEEIPDRVY